ncbi:GT4 family glycosyltransferase PelF [Herbaspirillum seropedicae]|uniref:GT4 family glycosyltransferase PelF n=2 Tax=Herbaspirillum seropedicae TaxID=964 RepID=UPI00084826B3|nr:GT4 family glycosyltransferase PelF [Herbaspirillum seropedicae]AON56591.1 glycosyltransferase [Herbaspirillum seropedicae]
MSPVTSSSPAQADADRYQRRADSCDVMLLLEGTFPYVSGGVSSWVNQIIRGFPHLRFGLCFIGSRRQDYGAPKYALPDNVVHLETHYIHENLSATQVVRSRGDAQAFAMMDQLHGMLRAYDRSDSTSHSALAAQLAELIPMMADGGKLDQDAFLFSKQSWDYLTAQYRTFCTDPSFVDYFWTVRIMHQPVWTLARVARQLIPARCYHTVSTGYAGFLGSLMKMQTGRPLILSEHGIYTKERKIDLFQSEWIRDNRNVFEKDASQIPYFREMWIRFFEALGRMCYQASNQIVALYETNRLRQIIDGAPPERTRNIPNGIDLPRLSALRAQRSEKIPPVLCLLGRVVPIKDVKTFIRAMRTVVNQYPEAEAWIAGPEDEDPSYAAECHAIAEGLGLLDKVKFLGYQKIDELMPKIGLVVLSSISEALPLVLLEGFAAGVPGVATDVGSCRQLIYGLSEEDQALGAAGDVVGIAEPQALAQAALKLLTDPQRWYAAQAAGIARVERYYTQEMMFGAYRELYDNALAEQGAAATGAAATALRCPVQH